VGNNNKSHEEAIFVFDLEYWQAYK